MSVLPGSSMVPGFGSATIIDEMPLRSALEVGNHIRHIVFFKALVLLSTRNATPFFQAVEVSPLYTVVQYKFPSVSRIHSYFDFSRPLQLARSSTWNARRGLFFSTLVVRLAVFRRCSSQ